ncbi:ROK family glucokinase [Kineococcus rubinsiae]|uniref:ROK family glucokinase n=1 Tax=Kineococcus rubinsiae TaxID=2609562 RepID=UPI0014308411|nr:ROK family glucokinase [Kineococcus rubinsiae]NIZ93593.1 ROK family glucokinase [Kineococcus rubinsiae]
MAAPRTTRPRRAPDPRRAALQQRLRQQTRRALIGDGPAVGVDIGGTKVAAGVVDGDGRVVAQLRRDTPTKSPQAVEDTIAEVVEELASQHEIVSVGIGAAGFVDAERATVLFAPHLAWRNEPLREAVERRVRARLGRRVGRRTVVENDANAAAWGEYRFGAGRGEARLVCVTMGTGIGGAIVNSGRVQRGRYGLAGEFGHMIVVPGGHRCECGNRGCWEQYASGNALVREAREMARAQSPVAHALLELAQGDPEAITGPLVTEAARAGDPAAIELFEEVGRWLGIGIANLAAALDPGTVVIGGGVSDADELLLGPAREAYRRTLTGRGFRPELRIVRAQLGPAAGLVGAADLSRGWG